MDRGRYPPEIFKSKKSATSHGLRLSYQTRQYLTSISSSSISRKVERSFQKYLQRVQQIIRGQHKICRQSDFLRQLGQGLAQDSFPLIVIANLAHFEFEIAKELLNIILRLLGSSLQLQRSIQINILTIVQSLLNFSHSSDLYILGGGFLRDLLSFSSIHQGCLNMGVLNSFIRLVLNSPFNVGSDAWDTFKALLNSQKEFVMDFLGSQSQEILSFIQAVGVKDYYYTRQSLTFTYSLLVLNGNQKFSQKYAMDPNNIKKVMSGLKESDPQIKIENFYLFAVILKILMGMKQEAAESLPVRILKKNQERMLEFFEHFLENNDDEDFQSDKQETIDLISKLLNQWGGQEVKRDYFDLGDRISGFVMDIELGF